MLGPGKSVKVAKLSKRRHKHLRIRVGAPLATVNLVQMLEGKVELRSEVVDLGADLALWQRSELVE